LGSLHNFISLSEWANQIDSLPKKKIWTWESPHLLIGEVNVSSKQEPKATLCIQWMVCWWVQVRCGRNVEEWCCQMMMMMMMLLCYDLFASAGEAWKQAILAWMSTRIILCVHNDNLLFLPFVFGVWMNE